MSRFSKERYILWVNYLWIDIEEGTCLEPLVDETTWMCNYLVHRNWSRHHLMNKRDNPTRPWTEEDYFRWAEKTMKEQGIKP